MANNILTIDMITRKALQILENNLVLTRNVNRQYDDSFAVEGAKIGSTLRIRLPDRALVTDGAALQVQDDNEQSTTLTVANQPLTSYIPGAPGTPTNVLGVYFPGGDVASLAPTVPETVVNYWDFKDNENYPVQVPSGGQIIVKIE